MFLEAAAAAAHIASEVDRDADHKISVEDRHRMSFVEAICSHLGLNPTAIMMSHVHELLRKHGIERPRAEYPKEVTIPGKPKGKRGSGDNTVIVHSEEEELAALSPPPQESAADGEKAVAPDLGQ